MEETDSKEKDPRDEISVLRAELASERRERELSLVAQEHRLLPAIGNLTKAWSHPDPAMRAELWPRAAQALFWCLLPRPLTAGLTLTTVLTLAFAFWQAGLALDQTDQMKVQNSLAQAQRQASIASSGSDLFGLIEDEKNNNNQVSGLSDCGENITEKCWEEGRFVLSDSLSGRIVSLTQALGPYKSVEEEDDFSGDATCTEGVFSMLSGKAMIVLLQTKWLNGKPLSLERVRQEFSRRYSNDYELESKGILSKGKAWINDLAGYFRSDAGVKLACSALSPERGQLLIALLAANVSVQHLEKLGASFEYSKIRGKLKAKSLKGISLAHASLTDVSFSETEISMVNFSGADLRGAIFSEKISKLNLSNARIQVDIFGIGAIDTFIKNNGSKAFGVTNVTMNGVKGEARDDWCAVAQGRPPILPPVDLKDMAILVERRVAVGGYNETSLLIKKKMSDEGLIFSGTDKLGSVELLYYNLDGCGERTNVQIK